MVVVVLTWGGGRQVEPCQSVDLWHRSNIRWSGPPVNKLPVSDTELMIFDRSCAAAQLWR
jgi:hypothetical protein